MSSTDTTPEAANVQIALLKEKTTAERLALTFALSNSVIALSKRAIQRANPEFTSEDLRCRFVELHYGADIAKAFRRSLLERLDDTTK
jgi:hypothetical protein